MLAHVRGGFYGQSSAYPGQPLVKDTGKEVDIGEGEKGVTLSYLGVDISKNSYTLEQVCIVQSLTQSRCEFIVTNC